MSKDRPVYLCTECRGTTPKWQGQCPQCGAWNTLELSRGRASPSVGYAGESEGRRLLDVSREPLERRSTGIGELDRVLVLSTRYISAGSQVPKVSQILPIEAPETEGEETETVFESSDLRTKRSLLSQEA